MSHILLIEDSLDSQLLVRKTLSPFYQVICVNTLNEASERLSIEIPDLILLDVTLPDGDGFDFCSKLQNEERFLRTSLIFLTAKSNLADRVLGFSLGADDYIVKPFEPLELRARVEAKLRKSGFRNQFIESISKAGIRINIPLQKAYLILENRQERELPLTPIEFKILFHFLRNEQTVMTRDQLIKSIWGEQVVMTDRTVDKHISSLRDKLDEKGRFIETVPRSGYRFSSSS